MHISGESSFSTMSERSLLVVCSHAATFKKRARALRQWNTLHASTVESALERCRTTSIAAVVTEFQLDDGDGETLLTRIEQEHPQIMRVLLIDYHELKRVIQAQANGMFHAVLSSKGRDEILCATIEKLLQPELDHDCDDSRSQKITLDTERTQDDFLSWTVSHLASVNGCLLRQLPHSVEQLKLEFVLPKNEETHRLIQALPQKWDAPWKVLGQPLSKAYRYHPVAQHLGTLTKDQSLYVSQFGKGYAYLLVLPWKIEEKITILLGLFPLAVGKDPLYLHSLLESLHRLAQRELPEFPQVRRPDDVREQRQTQQSGAWYCLEYDWIVAPNYVGPDRRRKQTTFINSFVLTGKRRHLPSLLPRRGTRFVDRLTRTTWILTLLYLAFSVADTLLTFTYIHRGPLQELNPVLRWALAENPWIFIGVKNFFSLVAIFIITRFQLSRLGTAILWLNLILYGALDAYWIVLLMRLS